MGVDLLKRYRDQHKSVSHIFTIEIRQFTLHVLDLTHMGIERIDVGAFCGLQNVTRLMLSGNRIITPPPVCPLKCCLLELILDNNNTMKFSKIFLKGFRRLEKIHLDYNNIVQLPDVHWVQHTLQELRPNSNNISSLDALHTYAPFKSLVIIYIGFNQIRSFNVTLLHHLTRRTQLHLNSNKLTYIDDFRSYHIESINLAGNPWHCDATLSWMGEEDMPFEKALTCATPSCLHGMEIAEMSI